MSIACLHSTPADTAPTAAGHVDDFSPSDNVLIDRMARADETALRILVGRHQARISRFILRFVGDRNLVEDLVSDTFFAAWQQAPNFENRSSVATWLLAIARYKALSARQRRTIPTEAIDDVVVTALVDQAPQPDAACEHQDAARFLRRCLAELPAEQAILIELVYYRDRSVKEAAMLAKIPENTVKSRMFLARKKLAVLLAAADIGSAPISLKRENPGCEREDQSEALHCQQM